MEHGLEADPGHFMPNDGIQSIRITSYFFLNGSIVRLRTDSLLIQLNRAVSVPDKLMFDGIRSTFSKCSIALLIKILSLSSPVISKAMSSESVTSSISGLSILQLLVRLG